MQEIYWERQLKQRFSTPKARLKTFSLLATGFFILLVAGLLFVGILFAWYAKDLPRPDKVRRVEGLSTVVLDRNGETIYDIFEDANRIPVKWEDVPTYLKNATVAIEDKEFYKHPGLSTAGIVRAMISTIVFRNIQGGSTLTQQLVKNVLLTNEQTLPRKLKEAILAVQIERKYTKDEILLMYLNEAPYGGTAVGIESASQLYFGKHAKDLTLVEAVVLAGLPQSPSYYSPFIGDAKAYITRGQSVARRMHEDGYITDKEEEEIKNQLPNVVFASGNGSLRAPHFIAYVKELLIEKFGQDVVDAGGLKVTTTLDLKLQDKAETIVKEEVDKVKYLKVSNGAAVVLDPTSGEILSMIGSKDYTASESGGYKFNVVTQGLRQPGSTMKPIIYAAAFKKGYTPATLLMDVETKYPSGDTTKPEYNPKNYDLKYRGPMLLRYALGNSINTIAVKVSALVGVRESLRTAYDMGITSLEPTDDNLKRIGLSLTLGGGEVKLLEISQAFGVFATGGNKVEPIALLKVEDAKGKILFEQKKQSAKKVLNSDVAYLISSILSDNDARKAVFGERSYLAIPGYTVAVKTGTTDDKRDNWTIGYTPSLVVGVWVGNNDNSAMNSALASGTTGAAPIWNRIIKEALKSKKDEPFVKPSTIVEVEIDGFAGGTPYGDQPKRKEFFVKGTEPTTKSSVYQSIKVSKKDNNKLANQVEITKGEYDSRDFIVFKEEDPVSSDGKNRWQEGIDAWVSAQGDSRYHVPRETYEGGDTVALKLKEPGDYVELGDTSVRVRAEASATEEVKKIEIFVDGDRKKEVSGTKTIDEVVEISKGSHLISVRATDSKGNTASREAHVGIKEPYTTPTPVPTLTPEPTT